MPTARELLEQADALMRRNRSAVPDDIPVLTEAVSPRPAFRVPLRPSPESAPAPVEEEAPENIPTLTEKVAADERSPDAGVAAEGEPSDWLDLAGGEPSITGQAPSSVLGVPEARAPETREAGAPAAGEADEARDEVASVGAATEEIDLLPAEAAFDEELGGARPAAAPAAPEEAAVPLSAEAPAATEQAWVADEGSAAADAEPVPAPEPDTPGSLPAAVTDEAASGGTASPLPFAAADAQAGTAAGIEPPLADAADDRSAHAHGASLPDTELPPEIAPLPALAAETEIVFDSPTSVSWNVEAALSAPDESVVEAAPEAPVLEAPAADASAPFAAAPATEADEPVLSDVAATLQAPVSLAPSPAEAFGAPPAVTPPAPVSAADDPRWAAMAEEIRMQVLQRIDLFTDTGLREQLGRRLQPIVDRASADLVATINQHVGELLRAYVAEAIEREIEKWKSSSL